MKKKILVLQFRTGKSLAHERKCLLKNGYFKKDNFKFVNILNPKKIKIKNINSYTGVILGGSGEINISNWDKKIQSKIIKIKPILKKIIREDFPTLGICFGHQLIADLMGGKVVRHKDKAETGVYKICINKEGLRSPLFKNFPKTFFAVNGHNDSVVKIPKNAKLLASSKRCKIHALRIRQNIYTVQFHPELDEKEMYLRAGILKGYALKKQLIKRNINKKLTKMIFKNFHTICVQNSLRKETLEV